jgi:hypothetical protein
MGKAWKYLVIASMLAAALWAAGSSKAEAKAQPKAFNSAVAFDVYAVSAASPATAADATSRRQTAVEDLFRFAPKGTWAVRANDVRQTSAARDYFLWRSVPIGFHEATASVMFFLPPWDGWRKEPDVAWCGIVKLSGTNKRDMENALGHGGTETTVEGVRAYKHSGEFEAVMDGTTCLWGSDEQALATMIRAYRDGEAAGLSPRLQELVTPFAGRARHTAVIVPEGVDFTDLNGYPPRGAKSLAESYSLTEGFGYFAMAEFSDEKEAQAALARAKARVAEAREEWAVDRTRDPETARDLRQYGALLDRASLTVNGREVHVELALGEDDLAALPRFWMADMLNSVVLQAAVNFGDPATERLAAEYDLRDVWSRLSAYAEANGQYPSDAVGLIGLGFDEGPQLFVKATDRRALQRWDLGERLFTCEYVGFIPNGIPTSPIICYTAPGLFHDRRCVLRADGSREWVTEDQLHDRAGNPKTSLRASYDAVVKAFGSTLTEERRAELRKFYEVQD